MFPRELLQGLKALSFQILFCCGWGQGEFQGSLKYYLITWSTFQPRITLDVAGFLSWSLPGLNSSVCRLNLLCTSIEKCLGGSRNGLRTHASGWQAQNSTNCPLVCGCQWNHYIYSLTELVGCLTWLNGWIVWASLARANRWAGGHQTGSANLKGWL